MITAAKYITLFLGLSAASTLSAETYLFEGITDFTDINAGEVPYYRHNGVNALAINAAIESYRDKFARATVVFEATGGLFDVTITSLGETDGDGEFRFLVDGEIQGYSVNEPASEDYGFQYHTFENINIPTGALIGVESSAVSNGLIPEGDAYAYARGRWTTLSITSVESTDPTPDPVQTVDLGLSLAVSRETSGTDEIVTYSIEVVNYSDEFTATNPEVTIDMANGYYVANEDGTETGYSEVISDACGVRFDNKMTCPLPELGPNDSTTITLMATATASADYYFSASVEADQDDLDNSNNSDEELTTINMAPPPDYTVDLALTLSADKNQTEVGETITFTVDTSNYHATNTATTPRSEIYLPYALEFQASDICTALDRIVTCYTAELAPGSNNSVMFSVIATSADNAAQLIASVESAEADSNILNNKAAPTINITPVAVVTEVATTEQEQTQEPTTANEPATANKKATSGGGAWSFITLQLLALLAFRCRRQNRYVNTTSTNPQLLKTH